MVVCFPLYRPVFPSRSFLMSFLSFFRSFRSSARRPSAPRPRLRLGVEVLEGRSLPSTTSLLGGVHHHHRDAAHLGEGQVEHGGQVEVHHNKGLSARTSAKS